MNVQQRRLFFRVATSNNEDLKEVGPLWKRCFRPCGWIAVITSAALLFGCSSLTPARVNVLADIVGQAAQLGAANWLAKHPEDRQLFLDVIAELGAVLMTDRVDMLAPQSLEDAAVTFLAKLPTQTLQGKDGELYVTGDTNGPATLVVWDPVLGKGVEVQGEASRAVVKKIHSGLRLALAPKPPMPSTTKLRGRRLRPVHQSVTALLNLFGHQLGGGDRSFQDFEHIIYLRLPALVVESNRHGLEPDLFNLPAGESFAGRCQFIDCELGRLPLPLGDVDPPDGGTLRVIGEVHAPDIKPINQGVREGINVVGGEDKEHSRPVELHVLNHVLDNSGRGAPIGLPGTLRPDEQPIGLVDPKDDRCDSLHGGVGRAPVPFRFPNGAAEDATRFQPNKGQVEDELGCGGGEGLAGTSHRPLPGLLTPMQHQAVHRCRL